MKQLIILILFLLSCLWSKAQVGSTYFCGVVKDSLTNAPAAGVAVVVKSVDPGVSYNKVIITNPNGVFCDTLPYNLPTTLYTFTVTDCNGNPITAQQYIPSRLNQRLEISVCTRSTPRNCQANFSYQQLGNTIAIVNQSQGAQPLTYSWYFGDNTTSSEMHPVKTFENPGIYSVCLTVRDANGCSNTKCDAVRITASCNAIINADTLSNTSTVTFQGYSQASNVSVWMWEFGNGQRATGQVVTHTFPSPGTYNVCLTVVTTDMCTSRTCSRVTIRNNNCRADFESFRQGNTVGFENFSQGAAPITYTWDFGDGTTSNEPYPTK
ncbi:MAG: PKD domain-containing protein, partial [Bacteroidia bacterium]|nr:PKD domain-containing protein [Bacteroidia bacterium]